MDFRGDSDFGQTNLDDQDISDGSLDLEIPGTAHHPGGACTHRLYCTCAATLLGGILLAAIVTYSLVAAHRSIVHGGWAIRGIAAGGVLALASGFPPVPGVSPVMRALFFPLVDRAYHHPVIYSAFFFFGLGCYLALWIKTPWMLQPARMLVPEHRIQINK